jgi:phage-related protein
MFDLDFFTLANGTQPVREFLDSLDDKLRAKTIQELALLEELGNKLREPYSKSLGSDIFELRMKQSNNIARVFYFFFAGSKIIATHGFVKKRQKTPRREIERALSYKSEYERRERERLAEKVKENERS